MTVTTSMTELESQWGKNQVVSKTFAINAADASNKGQQQLYSTSSTSSLATTNIQSDTLQYSQWRMEILLESSSNSTAKDSNYLIHSYRVVCFETFWSVLTEPEVQTTVLQPHSIRISRLSRQILSGRLLARFQDDTKYEHVGQDTRSQGGNDDKDKQRKDLKILELKTKSKNNNKGSRLKIA
ncbi:hypothetical protein Tco_1027214 [Tanacetum coccineum]